MKNSIGDLVAVAMKESLNNENFTSLFKKASKKYAQDLVSNKADEPSFEEEVDEKYLDEKELHDLREITESLSHEKPNMEEHGDLHDQTLDDLLLASEALDEMGLGTASGLILKIASIVVAKKQLDDKKDSKKKPFNFKFFNKFKKKKVEDSKKKVSKASDNLLEKDIGEATFEDLEQEEGAAIQRQKARKSKDLTEEFVPSDILGQYTDEPVDSEIEVSEPPDFNTEDDEESLPNKADKAAKNTENDEESDSIINEDNEGLDLSAHDKFLIEFYAKNGIKVDPKKIKSQTYIARLNDKFIKNKMLEAEKDKLKTELSSTSHSLPASSPAQEPKRIFDIRKGNTFSKKNK